MIGWLIDILLIDPLVWCSEPIEYIEIADDVQQLHNTLL